MNTEHTNQSRAQFEAWASEHCCAAGGISFKRFSDDGADSFYNDPSVETAWQAWQAASQQQAEPVPHSSIDLQSIPKRQRDFTAENIRDIAHECMRIGDNEQAEMVFAIADALRDGNLIIQPPAQQQAEPVAPAVKKSLTAEPQAELATLCASCARADVNCPIYPQQTASCVEHRPAAQQQAEPVALPFFAYDSETGFERFATEAEAKAAAQESVEAYREDAGEGWAEEVENICWGVVLGTTREVALPDEYSGGNGLADSMKPVDYVLTDAAQPPAMADNCIPVPAEWIEGLLLGDRQHHIELRAMLAAAPQGADAQTPDLMAQLRALAKQHGWNFVWSKARLIEEGTKTCHKCHNGAITHSCLCVHYDKAKEQAAMAEYRAAAQKGGA